MKNADQNLLDLSALTPEPKRIKLDDGNIVEVKPPKVNNMLRIGFLGQKLQDAEGMSDEELDSVITKLTDQIAKVIPELNGIELNTPQLLAIVQLISEMGTAPTDKKLKEQGIEVSSPPKP